EVSTSLFTLDGAPVILTLIWDITERKLAEEKLRASEEKYQGLFESTTDGMFVLDARGEILDINSKATELFGLKKHEIIGKNILNIGILTPKALSIVVKQFQELLYNKRSTSSETEIILKDKKNLSVELTSFFLIKKDNEIDNFVLVIRDISD
ncbi:MAG: PAS domain-containing protein, partial [Thermoplasmatota archaeon]